MLYKLEVTKCDFKFEQILIIMSEIVILEEAIINKIYNIRGQKVMLDSDLAELYGVENKRLKEQVKRNLDRFPEDFMFELTDEEFQNLRSQIATSSWGGRRYNPYVFTEQGVSMLSSVLNSKIAIQVNIQIIRIFTKLREMILTQKDIMLKLEILEKQTSENNESIQLIFEALRGLLASPKQDLEPIGFKQKARE